MPKFAIYSPTLGKREDFPVLLLDKSVTPDNKNIRIEDGEIKTAKMRSPIFISTNSQGVYPGINILKVYQRDGFLYIAIDSSNLSVLNGNKFYINIYYTTRRGVITISPRFYEGTGEYLAEYDDVNYAAYPAGIKTNAETDADRIFLKLVNLLAIPGLSDTNGVLLYQTTTDTADNGDTPVSVEGTDFNSDTSKIVYGNNGFYQPGYEPVPDNNEILQMVRFTLPDGDTEYFIAFTTNNIYYWYEDEDSSEWRCINPLSNPDAVDQYEFNTTDYWDICLYNNCICATNGKDKPIYWYGVSEGAFNYFSFIDTAIDEEAEPTTITTAKFIASYYNYLILGNVTLSGGSTASYHNYIFWSSIGEGVNKGGFVQGRTPEPGVSVDAGYAVIDGDGEISGGMETYRGMLLIFKRSSIRKLWFTGSIIPFAQDEHNAAVGCLAPGSVIHDKDGNLFFYGTDKTFREALAGVVSGAIPETARVINDELLNKIRSTYIKESNELWWAVPYGSISSTIGSELTSNNKILSLSNGRWTVRDISITAFGQYIRQLNYDWTGIPFNSWDECEWDNWDNSSEFKDVIDVCGDSDGYVYIVNGGYTDNGNEYESYFTLSTDMSDKQSLAYQKRILQMFLYFDTTISDSSDIEVFVKTNNELNYVFVGKVTIDNEQYKIVRKRLVCDIRAGHFLLKISSKQPFRFIGVEFEYRYAGDR